MKGIGVLHVITDTSLQTRFTHEHLAALAVAGGADTVQFRQKGGTTRQLVETALAMKAVCQPHRVPLIVNDRLDVALAVASEGVHFGQDDLEVAIGRRLLPAEAIIGASARSVGKILAAIEEGADYIGFGPVYPTLSKADAEEPKGLEGLRRMCAIATCPVIAIGGITPERTGDVIRAGAHGVAVISAVCCQADPEEATRRFRSEIEKAR